MTGSLLRRIAGVAGRAAPPSLRVLILHDVPEEREADLRRLLEVLSSVGRIADPARLESMVASPSSGPSPTFVLSFDDGFRSQYRAARRILEPLGLRAVFFVCPGFLDSGDEWTTFVERRLGRGPGVAGEACRPMSWEEAAELLERGHVIASHTVSHPRLSEVTAGEARREARECLERLRTELGDVPPWIAYPFGDVGCVDAGSVSVLRQHFDLGFTGVRGSIRGGEDPMLLPREAVDLGRPSSLAVASASGLLDVAYWSRRRRLRRLAVESRDPRAEE